MTKAKINFKENFKNFTNKMRTDEKEDFLLLLCLLVSFEVDFLIFLFLRFPHHLQKVSVFC